MGVIRGVLGVVVVLLLTISLVAGHAAVAVDRTAANEEFVTTTLEEEQAYTKLQSIAGDQAADQVERTDLPVEIDARRIVNDTLRREYLRNQTEANVNRTFRFLEGDSEELNVSVNLVPAKENVAGAVEREVRDRSVGELLDIVTASQNLSTEVEGVQLDLRIVANMSESPEAYNESRESFRADIRQQVINRTYEDRSNDELLRLIGENPEQYNESQKERIVRQREGEIKRAIRNESSEAIDDGVNETLAAINDEISSAVGSTVQESIDPRYDPVAEPATNMLVTGVEGLTTNKSYAEFDSELSADKSNLAGNVSTVLRNDLDSRVDDRFDLIEDSPGIDDGERQQLRNQLQSAQTRYQQFDLLVLVLPLVSLGLIGLLFLITRSISTTALWSGLPMAIVGGGTYALATVAPGAIESQVESELSGSEVPEAAVDLALGVVDQTIAVVAGQSLLLALLGVGLIVGGVALRASN